MEPTPKKQKPTRNITSKQHQKQIVTGIGPIVNKSRRLLDTGIYTA